MVQIQKALTIQTPGDIAVLWEIVSQPNSGVCIKSIEAWTSKNMIAELVIIEQVSAVEPRGVRSNSSCK